jgi:hypothetical protein
MALKALETLVVGHTAADATPNGDKVFHDQVKVGATVAQYQ